MVLEQKDILQINATIIAGALIFLTVITITGSTTTEIISQIHAMIIALGVIIFFSLSSICVERKYQLVSRINANSTYNSVS